MSKRTERREAERLARKLAYKQLRQQQAQRAQPSITNLSDEAPANAPTIEDFNTEDVNHLFAKAQAFFHAASESEDIPDNISEEAAEPQPTPQPESTTEPTAESNPQPKPISDARLNANRANAQRSTGPTTSAGQARSAMNALKTGLTGKTVLLPHEDATEFQHQLEAQIDLYKPVTDEELRLVQSISDCIWRLHRIQHLESAILLKGQIEFAKQYQDRSPIERTHLIYADAYLKYERQLRNLHIQEARLRRTMEKERALLTQIQTMRRQTERAAALLAEKTKAQNPNGFEFATASQPGVTQPNPAAQHRKQAA